MFAVLHPPQAPERRRGKATSIGRCSLARAAGLVVALPWHAIWCRPALACPSLLAPCGATFDEPCLQVFVESWQRFWASCQRLQPHLGPILFQFPSSFATTASNGAVDNIERLRTLGKARWVGSCVRVVTTAAAAAAAVVWGVYCSVGVSLPGWRIPWPEGATSLAHAPHIAQPAACLLPGAHMPRFTPSLPPLPATGARLQVLPASEHFVFEFRHKSWLCPEVYAVMGLHDWCLAITHMTSARGEKGAGGGKTWIGSLTPGPNPPPEEYPLDACSWGAYCRFHGSKGRYVGAHGPAEMQRWADWAKACAVEGKEVRGPRPLPCMVAAVGGSLATPVPRSGWGAGGRRLRA